MYVLKLTVTHTKLFLWNFVMHIFSFVYLRICEWFPLYSYVAAFEQIFSLATNNCRYIKCQMKFSVLFSSACKIFQINLNVDPTNKILCKIENKQNSFIPRQFVDSHAIMCIQIQICVCVHCNGTRFYVKWPNIALPTTRFNLMRRDCTLAAARDEYGN